MNTNFQCICIKWNIVVKWQPYEKGFTVSECHVRAIIGKRDAYNWKCIRTLLSAIFHVLCLKEIQPGKLLWRLFKTDCTPQFVRFDRFLHFLISLLSTSIIYFQEFTSIIYFQEFTSNISSVYQNWFSVLIKIELTYIQTKSLSQSFGFIYELYTC
jgi:hypothetical protein